METCVSTLTEVFVNYKRMNVCEHTVTKVFWKGAILDWINGGQLRKNKELKKSVSPTSELFQLCHGEKELEKWQWKVEFSANKVAFSAIDIE